MDFLEELFVHSRNWSHPLVLDISLMKLTEAQRRIFITFTTAFVLFAIFGNFATIIFNIRRQIRPFFRSCLISLAASDIIHSGFSSVTYLSQLIDERTILWRLGHLMCSCTPFFTTMAIFVNSLTLVGIAFDRYTAVMKVFKSSWELSPFFCSIGTLIIWGIGAGIATPMLFAYTMMDIKVAETHPNNRSIGIRIYEAEICINDKSKNSIYYEIVFSALFLPMILAFLWLNTTIALEIWNRRRSPVISQKFPGKSNAEGASSSSSDGCGSSSHSNPKHTEGTTTTGIKTTTNTPSSLPIKSNPHHNQRGKSIDKENQLPRNQENPPKHRKSYQFTNNCRRKRQFRMFKVILVIMATFLVCRLPTWIFLLIKMNRNLSGGSSYVVHFSLGILSLFNCAVNPFLYTFLTETIRFGEVVTVNFGKLCCICFCCFGSKGKNKETGEEVSGRRRSSSKKESLVKTGFCCSEGSWSDDPELQEDNNKRNLSQSEFSGRKSYSLDGKSQNNLNCISSRVLRDNSGNRGGISPPGIQ